MISRLGVLLALIFTLGCSNNVEHDHHHHHQGSPDSTAQLTIHVEAMQRSGISAPLKGAQIFLTETVATTVDHHHHPEGRAAAVTDEHGNTTLSLAAGVQFAVHITADGHDTIVRRFKEPEGAKRQLWVTTRPLQRKTITLPESGAIDVQLGDTMGGTKAPVTLTIEAGDLARDNGGGAAATGDVDIVFTSWDPAIDPPSALPSDLMATDAPLYSYGMFRVEYYQGDHVLNVRSGQTIKFEQVVHSTRRGRAQDAVAREAIKVSSFDHNSGLWVIEDATTTFTEETGVLTAEATHFSCKNMTERGPFPANSCMNITAVNRDGVPVNASIEVQGFGAPGGDGCINMACMMDEYVTVVISTEDTNGNGVLDRGEDVNGNGELDVETETRGDAAGNVRRSIAVARQVPGQNYWQRNTVAAETLCNDNNEILGCGVGSCADVQVLVCSPQGEACNERADCCGRLGCFDNACETCRQVRERCQTSDECCAGSVCLDYTCWPR